MHQKPTHATLSHAWLKALAQQSNVQIPEHVSALFEVLRDITDIAIQDYISKSSFAYKSDNTPSGDADSAIENLLKMHLLKRYPHYAFTGEETGSTANAPKQGDKRWLVDPIDGTRNNEYGRADFGISIACQSFENNKWQTIDALLAMPVTGEVLWASSSQKATYALNYNPLIGQAPNIAAIKIDDTHTYRALDRSLIDLSIKPFPPAYEAQLIQKIREAKITHRNVGSAAIALANVGSKNDGAIVLAHDYDVAAAVLIAEQAGAIVSEEICTAGCEPLSLVIAGRNAQMYTALKQQCNSLLTLEILK